MSAKETRWCYIKELYKQENYNQCLLELEQFNRDIEVNPDMFYSWKVKFQIALCLKKIGRIGQAMNCAKASLQYAITASDKTQVFWMIGCCYENINKQQSAKYYERAIINYEKLGLIGYVYALKFNIAKLNNNLEKMEKYINLLAKESMRDKVYLPLLNNGYGELFNIYITENDTRKAILLMKKVTDKHIKDYMITTIQQSKVVCISNK